MEKVQTDLNEDQDSETASPSASLVANVALAYSAPTSSALLPWCIAFQILPNESSVIKY